MGSCPAIAGGRQCRARHGGHCRSARNRSEAAGDRRVAGSNPMDGGVRWPGGTNGAGTGGRSRRGMPRAARMAAGFFRRMRSRRSGDRIAVGGPPGRNGMRGSPPCRPMCRRACVPRAGLASPCLTGRPAAGTSRDHMADDGHGDRRGIRAWGGEGSSPVATILGYRRGPSACARSHRQSELGAAGGLAVFHLVAARFQKPVTSAPPCGCCRTARISPFASREHLANACRREQWLLPPTTLERGRRQPARSVPDACILPADSRERRGARGIIAHGGCGRGGPQGAPPCRPCHHTRPRGKGLMGLPEPTGGGRGACA